MKPGGCCRRDEMRLEEDFSKVYEAEMQELKEVCENHVNEKSNPPAMLGRIE